MTWELFRDPAHLTEALGIAALIALPLGLWRWLWLRRGPGGFGVFSRMLLRLVGALTLVAQFLLVEKALHVHQAEKVVVVTLGLDVLFVGVVALAFFGYQRFRNEAPFHE